MMGVEFNSFFVEYILVATVPGTVPHRESAGQPGRHERQVSAGRREVGAHRPTGNDDT